MQHFDIGLDLYKLIPIFFLEMTNLPYFVQSHPYTFCIVFAWPKLEFISITPACIRCAGITNTHNSQFSVKISDLLKEKYKFHGG